MASNRDTTNGGRSIEVAALHAVRSTRTIGMRVFREKNARVMNGFSTGDLVLVAYGKAVD